MEEDLDISDYFRIIYKRRKLIIVVTILALLIGGLHYLVKPKIYESDSVVQLTVLPIYDKDGILAESGFFISREEAKNIITSSTILDPVLNSFYKKESRPSSDEFAKNNLKVEMINEKAGNTNFMPPFLRITVKANDPELSMALASAVTNSWMDYINNSFTAQKNLILIELNESEETNLENYLLLKHKLTVGNLQDRIQHVKSNIDKYLIDVKMLEEDTSSIPESSLAEDSIAKILLMRSVLDSYKIRLSNEQQRLSLLEDKMDEENKEFYDALLYMKEPKIIDYPKKPRTPINSNLEQELMLSFGAGLFISILLAFMLEWFKNVKKSK